MLALFFKAFQNTGIAFHLIPICEELGANPELITKSFMAIAVITGFVTFLLGHFFEKIGSRCIIILFLIVGCFYLFCFKQTSHAGAIYFFVFFAGCYWGMNQVVSYMVLPRVFGTDSIGSLNGWASGFMCLGSSLGPFIIGLIKDISSYQTALATCIVSACVLLIIGLAFNQKMHPQN